MNKIFFMMLIFGGLTLAVPANAMVNVVNLSDKPQSFNVSERTNESHIITIKPQATWQTYAQQVKISPLEQPENERIGRDWDTFAYWPNGEFGVQFRRRRHGNH